MLKDSFSIHHYKTRLSLELGHKLIKQRPGDRYIVAHPRSGSTWLRTVIVNVLEPEARSNPDVFNAVIPGVSIRSSWFRVRRQEGDRIISSHTWYRRDIPKAVYLVRDGRDVLVSFYHYLITRRQGVETLSFAKFFDEYCKGRYGYIWPEHVESWLLTGKDEMGDRLMVVRFEDMKADTEGVIGSILSFLNISEEPGRLRSAIEDARIERMRKIERSRIGELNVRDQSFYRGGRSGQWQDYFTPEIEEKFWAMSSVAMRVAGYKA